MTRTPDLNLFPPDIFRTPLQIRTTEGKSIPKWHFTEEPLQKKLLDQEAVQSPRLQIALHNNLTNDFVQSLHHKVTRAPPENINIEVKGQTRSGKSTVGISLAMLISRWWGYKFTEKNILPNQSELLDRLMNAEYGETFVVDEQTPETYGEGILRETEQLGSNLNICAKQCNNLIFIYPPSFTSRMAPYGLEAVAKDPINKYTKCFYYDLRRKEFGGMQIPVGYIIIPKYVDEAYRKIPQAKWSARRLDNLRKRSYDFDSLMEEQYEEKKDTWIEGVRAMDASIRDKKKHELAIALSNNPNFLRMKSNRHREAYIKLMVFNKEAIEMTAGEIGSIVDMAVVIAVQEIGRAHV